MKKKIVFAAFILSALVFSGMASAQDVLEAKFMKGNIPLNVDASAKFFAKAKDVVIPLMMQNITQPNGGGTIPVLRVQAIHNGAWLYIKYVWQDKTQDTQIDKVEKFTDAAALQFPLKNAGSAFMGDKTALVNIWQWKSSKQFAQKSAYPTAESDLYYDRDIAKTEAEQVAFQTGKAAGNYMSEEKWASPVEDLNAAGFGTLTTQKSQDVKGVGAYKNGKWTVIFARPLKTKDVNDAQFEVGKTYSYNVAVWDGSNKDRNGQKNVTLNWHTLKIAK